MSKRKGRGKKAKGRERDLNLASGLAWSWREEESGCVNVYVYVWRERERGREGGREGGRKEGRKKDAEKRAGAMSLLACFSKCAKGGKERKKKKKDGAGTPACLRPRSCRRAARTGEKRKSGRKLVCNSKYSPPMPGVVEWQRSPTDVFPPRDAR